MTVTSTFVFGLHSKFLSTGSENFTIYLSFCWGLVSVLSVLTSLFGIFSADCSALLFSSVLSLAGGFAIFIALSLGISLDIEFSLGAKFSLGSLGIWFSFIVPNKFNNFEFV